jgi:hypothetical protein
VSIGQRVFERRGVRQSPRPRAALLFFNGSQPLAGFPLP